MIVSFSVSLVLLCISMGLTITILYFKFYFYDKYKDNLGLRKNLLVLLPPILNFACAKTLIKIHEKITIKFTYRENYETVAEFERVLIFKTYIFNFLNLFNSIFIIMFIKPNFESFFGHCLPFNDSIEATATGKLRLLESTLNGVTRILTAGTNLRFLEEKEFSHPDNYGYNQNLLCYGELLIQTRAFFISSLTTNFFEILGKMAKKKRQKIIPSRTETEYSRIDNIIEEEYYLFPYQTTPEIDAVFSEYMEVMLIFGFLCCFGNIFPLGFFLVFLTIATEIFTDKYKLVHIVRRPIPKKVSRLGPWRDIMKYLAYLSIVVNSAFISFGSKSVDYFAIRVMNFNPYLTRTKGLGSSFNSQSTAEKDGELITDQREIDNRTALIRTTLFMGYILVLLLVKKIIDAGITDIPLSLRNLLRRHQNIKNRLKVSMTSNGESDEEDYKDEEDEDGYRSGFHFRLDSEDKNTPIVAKKEVKQEHLSSMDGYSVPYEHNSSQDPEIKEMASRKMDMKLDKWHLR